MYLTDSVEELPTANVLVTVYRYCKHSNNAMKGFIRKKISVAYVELENTILKCRNITDIGGERSVTRIHAALTKFCYSKFECTASTLTNYTGQSISLICLNKTQLQS